MATPEAVEFAALLKDLKDRSGRSYGVLAGKLHVSTSTLHRYCNGDAVPNEFAPVERFARVCGASGDELVEVHRRWIVADAARRRPPAAASASAGADAGSGAGAIASEVPPATAPAPTTGPTTARDAAPVDAASADAASADGASAEASAAAASPPGASVAAASAAGASGGGDRDPDHEGFVPDVTASDVAGGGRPPSPGSRWSRLSRRTRVLVAAAGVAALLVPTTVVAADLVGSGKKDGGSAADRVEDAGGDPGPTPEASASATPRPSASPRSADPSASASASPSGAPSVKPPAGSGPGQAQSGGGDSGGGTGLGAPPTVSISSYNWAEPCGQHYLVNQGPDGLDPPPAPQDRRGWAESYGGVDAGNMLLQLTVQGTSREAVVLKGMNIRVVSRKAPLPWSAYLMGNGCGSGIMPQTFASHLDAGHPTLRPVPGTQGDIEVPAVDFPYKVTSEDVEVFNLDLTAVSYDVTWYLELEWASGGNEGTLRIDDRGKPFRLSGMKGRPEYIYGNEEVGWEPAT
ncbi:helix-turn-helix domain-containing protein [Streptomyces anulatus]|uniref:Helix-turn-helix domain-containing protein n=1 Tax=Streptomyces anulatus TaxID=1892 RepID=A0A7K3RIP3_STRAQ|nr:helix-turn-helix domain-containing protein [Streptomyces anulatus]NED29557.1 helix-turn-helix domain-containing protein [Streptomyces anulatus]